MKTIAKSMLVAAFFIVALSTASFAQYAAQTPSAAQIVEILILEPIAGTAGELNFGTAGVETMGGTIVLAPDNNRVASGDVVLFPGPLAANAAGFSIQGTPGAAFTLTLPAAPITLTDGTNNMQAAAFTSSLPGNSGTIDGTGNAGFSVGGTLTVGGNQPVALYQGVLDISVNYN